MSDYLQNQPYERYASEEVISLSRQLIQMNSFEEDGKRKVLTLMKDFLMNLPGVTCNLYDMETDAPYLIASYGSETPDFQLLFQGHLDTVEITGMEDALSARLDERGLYGRGAVDMKSGCAAMACAFKACAMRGGAHGKVWLAYSTDEEYAAEKMRKALSEKQLPICDVALIAEPSSNKMTVCHKGNIWAEVSVHGKSAHGSMPEQGINAIYGAAYFTEKLRMYLQTAYLRPPHKFLGVPSMSVGTINGGRETNTVPDSCKITIDKRYMPHETVDEFIEELTPLMEETHTVTGCTLNLNILGDWPGVEFPIDTHVGKRAVAALGRGLGRPVEVQGDPSWGEGGYISKFGIQTFYFGPGDMDLCHTPQEFVQPEEILESVRAMTSLAEEFCF